MSLTVADRYTKMNRLPGQCSICYLPERKVPTNPSGRERVIITQSIIDFEGNLEFCETCIGEAARKLGYVTPAEHEKVQDELIDRTANCDDAIALVDEKDQLIASLTAALTHIKAEKVA